MRADPIPGTAEGGGVSTDQDEQTTPATDISDDANERRPWVVIVLLVLIVIGVAAAGFVLLKNVDTQPDTAEEIESAVVGVWETSDSPEPVTIEFAGTGEYAIRNFQGSVIVGTWVVTDDGLIEAPVAYRNYQGTWYFEPVSSAELHLEVTELEIDWTFSKTE